MLAGKYKIAKNDWGIDVTQRFVLMLWQWLTEEEHLSQLTIPTFFNYSCALSLEKKQYTINPN